MEDFKNKIRFFVLSYENVCNIIDFLNDEKFNDQCYEKQRLHYSNMKHHFMSEIKKLII